MVDENDRLHPITSHCLQFRTTRIRSARRSRRHHSHNRRQLPFSEETVSLVADRIVNTYGGNTSDYESTLTITDTIDFAGKVVTARGRTPLATQRMANYGAQALSELINEATFTRTGQAKVSFLVLTD